MPELYEITEAQAEAMSSAMAKQVLADQKAFEKKHDRLETWDRELAGYAVKFDDDGKPLKDKDGKYVLWDAGVTDVDEAPAAFRYWETQGLSHEKLFNMSVGYALSLRPEVKKILKKKPKDAGRRRSRRGRSRGRRRHTRKH